MPDDPTDLGFSYRTMKNGETVVFRGGRIVTTLRGQAAVDFLAEVNGAPATVGQQVMARVTGNYKRGNERKAADHPRNRARRDS